MSLLLLGIFVIAYIILELSNKTFGEEHYGTIFLISLLASLMLTCFFMISKQKPQSESDADKLRSSPLQSKQRTAEKQYVL